MAELKFESKFWAPAGHLAITFKGYSLQKQWPSSLGCALFHSLGWLPVVGWASTNTQVSYLAAVAAGSCRLECGKRATTLAILTQF